MSENSAIEWTDHTFNPWWGCSKVSPGCKNCYAETWAKRFTSGLLWGEEAQRQPAGDSTWRNPLSWNRKAKRTGARARVFCGSMCDVFEARADLDPQRARLWALIGATTALDWLLLTKRPENIPALIPAGWLTTWPANVWIGATVETQAYTSRLNDLRAVPAAVRFLSCEPLLGPITLGDLSGISWVIAGGESGRAARLTDPAWIRALRDDCRAAGVAFFVKQLGGWPDKHKRLEELPGDLRIREYPRPALAGAI